ncbi:MAG: hypothetical protein PEPC_00932 [Peptostreptococcus russellii]
MERKLVIIGNGFDIDHGLPTKFNPDFKNISEKYESDNFWDLYQSREGDIWSDFEKLLGNPDFNSLEETFICYGPDYLSDRESDRNGIIYQVDQSGKLQETLYEFANKAEVELNMKSPKLKFKKMFTKEDLFISFNYTHTLEKIYKVDYKNILHVHGEVGKSNLLLGYVKGEFSPEKYVIDVRKKGIGPFMEMDIKEYIDDIDDYYVRTAYLNLYEKSKEFYKEVKVFLMKSFLNKHKAQIDKIIVYGHSCAIDFDYFKYLNKRYSNILWEFYVMDSQDDYKKINNTQKDNVKNLVKKLKIENHEIIILK